MKITLKTIATPALLTALFVTGCNTEPNLTGSLTAVTTQEGSNTVTKIADEATRTTLAKTLSDTAAERNAAAPEALKTAFKKGIDDVRELGLEKSAKQIGDAAIDDELIGWDGKTVRLSKLWNQGPVVLMWYRGGWCPYCNVQLRAMQQSMDELESVGARLVVLTPELPEKAKETAQANDLDMVALHDRNNALAKKYGIMFDLPEVIVPIYRDKLKLPSVNGSDKLQLPLAATYVIDSNGKITYAFLDADYKKRAEPADVIEAVKAAAGS